MALTVNAPSSNVVQQYHGLQWISKNSSVIKPEYRRMAFEKYGKGVGAMDIFRSINNVVDVPNQTINLFLKESKLPTITLGAAISVGSAGANISVTLASTDYDTNDNGPLRVGDDIYIPKAYCATGTTSDRAYRVMSKTGSDENATYTCTPYAKDGGFYTTASRILTEVPNGTELIIGPNSFAAGSAQPRGVTDTFETITFRPRIMKETVDLEGGQVAQMFYEATGYEANKGVLNSALMDAEFRLDVKESRFFFMGEYADNTGLVETSESGVSNAIVSGAGMWPHADKYGMALSYSGDFILDNLYDAGILQQSKGITSGTSVFMVGPELGRDVESAALDFIQAYSGGTDLLDKVKQELGISVNSFQFDGRTYVIWRPDELADPTGAGLNINGTYTYTWATAGLIVPSGNVTVPNFLGRANASIPNVQIGYVNHNGEDRKRVLSFSPGVTGVQGYGNTAVSSYDGMHAYWLVQMTPLFALPEQWVRVYKS